MNDKKQIGSPTCGNNESDWISSFAVSSFSNKGICSGDDNWKLLSFVVCVVGTRPGTRELGARGDCSRGSDRDVSPFEQKLKTDGKGSGHGAIAWTLALIWGSQTPPELRLETMLNLRMRG